MTFNASKYVQYLEDWQVLIYLHENCKYCVRSNGVKRHFQRQHDDIYDLYTRQEIQRYAATLILCQPSDIVVPDHYTFRSLTLNYEFNAAVASRKAVVPPGFHQLFKKVTLTLNYIWRSALYGTESQANYPLP